MTVADLIKTLEGLPPQASVALRGSYLTSGFAGISRVELLGPEGLPAVVLIDRASPAVRRADLSKPPRIPIESRDPAARHIHFATVDLLA